MRISAVLILPAEYQQAGNALSVALGHDVEPGATYNVPLWTAADPMPVHGDPPSHYGCHALVQPEFVATLQAAAGGLYPEGVAPEIAAPVIGALIASFDLEGSYGSARAHFDAVKATHGLVELQQPMSA